jgi:hypothetical protein
MNLRLENCIIVYQLLRAEMTRPHGPELTLQSDESNWYCNIGWKRSTKYVIDVSNIWSRIRGNADQ